MERPLVEKLLDITNELIEFVLFPVSDSFSLNSVNNFVTDWFNCFILLVKNYRKFYINL